MRGRDIRNVLADVLLVANLVLSTVCAVEAGCRRVVLADVLVIAELELGAVRVYCASRIRVVLADAV